jgi:biopolymer transport protein ExbD
MSRRARTTTTRRQKINNAIIAIFILVLLGLFLLSRTRQATLRLPAPTSRPPMSVIPNAPILKVAVMADGRITVDGSPATVDSLRVALKRLAEQKGVVWYYRERGQAQAPPESAEILQAVIENRLPIRLSSRPDFSDAIGPDGRPIIEGSASN